MRVRSVYSYEDWERANALIKDAFFEFSDYIPMENLRIIEVRGMIIGSFFVETIDRVSRVNYFNIQSNFRSKGLGRKAVRAIVRYLKYKDTRRIEIISRKELGNFYQKHKFKVDRENDEYYYLSRKI